MTKTKSKIESINVTQETEEARIPVQRMGSVALGEATISEKIARQAAYLKGNKTQDHGTAAQQAGIVPKEDFLGGTPKTKLERKAARKDMDEELAGLSSTELTARADALLKEYEDGSSVEYPFTSDADLEPETEELDQDDENISSIEAQSREFNEIYKIARKQNPADSYETTPVDEDKDDHILDGMHIVDGRKGQ